VEYTVTIGPSTAISKCRSLTKGVVTVNVVIVGINPKTTSVSTQTPSKTQPLSERQLSNFQWDFFPLVVYDAKSVSSDKRFR
jgi:hypothetical protein